MSKGNEIENKGPARTLMWSRQDYSWDTSEKNRQTFSGREKKIPEESQGEDPSTRMILGLCQSCLSANSCKIEIPDGGIWHCKDYSRSMAR